MFALLHYFNNYTINYTQLHNPHQSPLFAERYFDTVCKNEFYAPRRLLSTHRHVCLINWVFVGKGYEDTAMQLKCSPAFIMVTPPV